MSEKKNYYVYLHRRKDNNEIFYVGKGQGSRHLAKNRNKEMVQQLSPHK